MDTQDELKGQACKRHALPDSECADINQEARAEEESNIPPRSSDGPATPYGLPGREEPPPETPDVSAFA